MQPLSYGMHWNLGGMAPLLLITKLKNVFQVSESLTKKYMTKKWDCTLRQEQLDKGHDKRRREETRAKTNNEKESESWLYRRPEESGVNTYCDLMKAREV
jgi:hypothetical protein